MSFRWYIYRQMIFIYLRTHFVNWCHCSFWGWDCVEILYFLCNSTLQRFLKHVVTFRSTTCRRTGQKNVLNVLEHSEVFQVEELARKTCFIFLHSPPPYCFVFIFVNKLVLSYSQIRLYTFISIISTIFRCSSVEWNFVFTDYNTI